VNLRIVPGRIEGTVALPGDKSQTHRALLLALLADGPVRIENPLRAGVVEPALALIRAAGSKVVEGDGAIAIEPGRRPVGEVSCGRSGTVMRLAMGALASRGARLIGDASLSRRPMERVAAPLRLLGADVRTTEGRAPIEIHPAQLVGADVALDVPSAQVQTAVVFAALQASGTTRVSWSGPLRDHTARLMRSLALPVRASEHALVVDGPAKVPGFTRTIPGDPSAAAFLAAAALVSGGAVELRAVGINPGRTGFFDAIARMGARVALSGVREVGGEPVADVRVESAALHGIDLGGDDVVRTIDELPVLAVVAACASGTTRVRDAAELRLKESDRIQALAAACGEIGVIVDTAPDGFTVSGRQRIRGGSFDPRGDHRLAMALAILGLVAEDGVTVQNAEIIGESFPGFGETLRGVGAVVDRSG
jgi:3-phosphoshikimate 1-carboxyvinyltransferase